MTVDYVLELPNPLASLAMQSSASFGAPVAWVQELGGADPLAFAPTTCLNQLLVYRLFSCRLASHFKDSPCILVLKCRKLFCFCDRTSLDVELF